MPRPPVPRLLFWASWVGLVWERAWPELWPLPTLIVGFGAAAALGLLPFGPIWLQQAVWMSAAIAFLGLGYRGLRAITLPSHEAILRRIELASELSNRPLSQIGGLAPVVGDDPVARALWGLHRNRMAISIADLRVPWPRAAVAARDPYALRAGALVLFVAGIVLAGNDAPARLIDGFAFPQAVVDPGIGAMTEIWITPPDYTGLSPIYLDGQTRDHRPIAVPVGSHLLVQVHDVNSPPVLHLGSATHPLQGDADRGYTLNISLPPVQQLSIDTAEVTLVSVPLQWIPDTPPTVTWAAPPRHTGHGALDLRYRADDDYGVVKLQLFVAPVGLKSDPQILNLAVPAPAQRTLQSEAFEDLTASPWAGLPVSLTLIASDAIGQTGQSGAVNIVLPERIFHHPVARAIAAQRKRLQQTPDQAGDIARAVSAISLQPNAYSNDIRVFLALRVAAWQLAADRTPAARESVAALLWRTAIRVEDGDAGQAEANLRAAEDALRQALADHAPSAEIHRLMQALRQAMSQYLQAMMKNSPASGSQNSLQGSGKTITPAALDAMLAHAEALARAGDQAGADAVMAQLERLMESLRFSSGEGGTGNEGLKKLSDLAHQQQDLIDQNFRRQNGTDLDQPPAGGDQGKPAQDQAALEQRLNEIAQQLGKAGQPTSSALGQASQAMAAAVRSLRQGADGDAMAAQQQALAAIRAAAQSLAMSLQGQGAGGEDQSGQDPLGRPGEGGQSPGDNELNLGADPNINRSRVILDELRRRQGDLQRPQEERDYIDRLLQNF